MKKFSVISLLFLTMTATAWACGGEMESHNNYMFSVFPREMMSDEMFSERINEFWKSYSNGSMEKFYQDDAMQIAKNKRDNEMVAYLGELSKYLEICDQLRETWDYPTKQQLQQRRQILNGMVTKSNTYRGTKLAPQWALLRMRANMVLGQYDANVTYWKQTASKMAPSVFRDMMESLYAAALARKGQLAQACDIYAKQGDMLSIKWALRKMRNLGGIRTIFDITPDSPTMNFLVQDFVNNAQETLDCKGDKEWIEETIDRRIILKRDVDNFINYANNVVSQGKTKSPAMWMAAIGELQFLYGKQDDALATLNKAVSMDGTQRMKDNARAIRLVVSVKSAKLGPEYSQWLVGELKWLTEKIKEEGKNNKEDWYNYYNNHYYDILDRVVYNELVPKYKNYGRPDIAAAFVNYIESRSVLGLDSDEESGGYSSDFFLILDSMSTDEMKQYIAFAQSKGGDALEQYLKGHVKPYRNYLNDILGTKYLAMADFSSAIDYLSKVPMTFVRNQAISPYMAQRKYSEPRWMGKQEIEENESEAQPAIKAMQVNKKIEFCREMTQLLGQLPLANSEKRSQIAYDLATRYYQASYQGDCWWLTAYGQSINDTARADRPDFVSFAIKYLNESAKSNDPTLKLNSLYGLAFIPIDEWCDRDYDWENDRVIIKPRRNSRQFKALNDLSRFVSSGNAPQPVYVTKCDVLKQFKKFI